MVPAVGTQNLEGGLVYAAILACGLPEIDAAVRPPYDNNQKNQKKLYKEDCRQNKVATLACTNSPFSQTWKDFAFEFRGPVPRGTLAGQYSHCLKGSSILLN